MDNLAKINDLKLCRLGSGSTRCEGLAKKKTRLEEERAQKNSYVILNYVHYTTRYTIQSPSEICRKLTEKTIRSPGHSAGYALKN